LATQSTLLVEQHSSLSRLV